jgi:hypothetical protein
MGDVVNLRRVRKRVLKQVRAAHAAENRTAFGLSKAERELQQARSEKAAHDLDRHRLESGEANEIAGSEALDRDRGPQDECQS